MPPIFLQLASPQRESPFLISNTHSVLLSGSELLAILESSSRLSPRACSEPRIAESHAQFFTTCLQILRQTHHSLPRTRFARPLVHGGFLQSWLSDGLNARVLERVRAIVADSTVDRDEFKIFVTGESLAPQRAMGYRVTPVALKKLGHMHSREWPEIRLGALSMYSAQIGRIRALSDTVCRAQPGRSTGNSRCSRNCVE